MGPCGWVQGGAGPSGFVRIGARGRPRGRAGGWDLRDCVGRGGTGPWGDSQAAPPPPLTGAAVPSPRGNPIVNRDHSAHRRGICAGGRWLRLQQRAPTPGPALEGPGWEPLRRDSELVRVETRRGCRPQGDPGLRLRGQWPVALRFPWRQKSTALAPAALVPLACLPIPRRMIMMAATTMEAARNQRPML